MASNLPVGMFPTDIYELYNERLVADQPFVDCIVASISYDIYYNISEGLQSYFLYDTAEWIGNQSNEQKVRVIDQVILYFRSRGIRCYLDNWYKFNYNTSQIPMASENSNRAPVTILKVEWLVRQSQEYMKAYL